MNKATLQTVKVNSKKTRPAKVEQHITADEKNAFARVLDILHYLRSPEGCPWDKEQTLESIRKNMLEECSELIEAIHVYVDKKKPTKKTAFNLREEFGDVFLVLSMMLIIYQEDEAGAIQLVLQELSDKLIRRHPHVFERNKQHSGKTAISGKYLSEQWQKIKQEKEGKSTKLSTQTLASFHPMLDTLERAKKVQSAIKHTKSENTSAKTSASLYKELDNLTIKLIQLSADKKCGKPKNKKEKNADKNDGKNIAETIIGDMLYTVVGLAKKHQISPAPALLKTIKKAVQNTK